MNIIAINKRSIFAVVLVLALALAMVPQGAFAKSSGNKGFSGKPSTEADEIIKVAKSKLGCPYVSGAAGPNAFDCSGFVAYCMHRVGIKLTRGSAASYYKAGYNVGRNMKKAQKGDIILYYQGGGIGHCAIYIGNGNVIHATCHGGIRITKYYGTYQTVAAIIRTYTPAGAAKITVKDKTKKVAGTKYKVIGKGKVKTVRANKKGVVKVKNLKAGTYKVVPVSVGKEYADDMTKTIKVKNGKTTKVKFSNIFTKVQMLKEKAQQAAEEAADDAA